jgi:threonine dehydrogenase-like Zn-dependent dehydrogenase
MIRPGVPDSAELGEMPPPQPGAALLVRSLAVGICGTDIEMAQGKYGTAPAGCDHLVIGHESLGQVVEAPPSSGFTPGDLVVGIVRRPDPVPCSSCAIGEWDMCRNGRYTERGIKGRHGFASEFFTIRPEYAVKVEFSLGRNGVLLEPASVVAKAWEHIERIGHRTRSWEPRRVLVMGAGTVGLLAALIGVQRGFEVHVLDRVAEGKKPEIVRGLGAHYYAGPPEELALHPDIVLECTGATSLIFDAVSRTTPGGIVCLTGISSGGRTIEIDLGVLNRSIVLENDTIFGTVNANRRHYELAARVLLDADPSWLSRLITRSVPIERWREAFERTPDDIKTTIEFGRL